MEGMNSGIMEALKERVLEGIKEKGTVSDEELLRLIDSEIALKTRESHISLSERISLRKSMFNGFRKLDLLQELVDDKSISEIMINGPKDIFIEKNGRMVKWAKSFESGEQLENIIQQIVSRINRSVNTGSPIVDARLEDGSLVHVVLPPVALNGPTMTIRKFPEPITIEKLIALKSLGRDCADFLKLLVECGYNMFISGGTNSGKSTFLNALSAFIPSSERVITIEDSAELQIRHIPNLVRLETRNANSEGEGEISMSELIKASLRMNPSRIIVGEVRGREAIDMLSAMNTGHSGSLSTGHSNSSRDMLSRLETMVLMGVDMPIAAIRNQIASALDILIHLGRLSDGTRKVLEISEIGGYENGEIEINRLYKYDAEENRLEKCGSLKNIEKLRLCGKERAL